MKTAGIDIGSRTIKVTILEGSTLVDFQIVDTGIDPINNAKKMIQEYTFDGIVATGYGRYLAQSYFNCPVITEIKAYALGAHFLFPECRTVIDVGGQDSKIIRVNNGKVVDFAMNDRCAAGTGKFLEVMATTLGYTIDELGEVACKAKDSVSISSMCTVFAESEVISLISRGEKPESIALGLHQSIMSRILAMMGKTGFDNPIVFGGGVAKNRCMVELLKKKFGKQLLVPQEPQIIGALGAGLVVNNKQRGDKK